MTNYSEEVLNNAINNRVILIGEDNSVWVGFFIKDWNNMWRVLGVDIDNSIGFKRSYIKKIIYLRTGYVLPKESIATKLYTKKINPRRIRSNYLDIFEMNELLNKAGCQFL